MPCPTCDHTMEGIGYGMFHCPRCGTMTNCPAKGNVNVPALVGRCLSFKAAGLTDAQKLIWHQLGIAESINLPGRLE